MSKVKHPLKPSKTLYTASDVKAVRTLLLKQQNGLDALTGLPIPDGQAVLDHDHETDKVRSVLHRQVNAFEGVVKNAYVRYISWNKDIPISLEDLLIKVSNYISKDHDTGYVHPAWLKRIRRNFLKLKAVHQISLLNDLNIEVKAGNSKERVSLLLKNIKKYEKHQLDELLKKYEEKNNNS